LKESWERSNKGEDSMEFILREHTRRNAFQEMLSPFADRADSLGDGQASERNETGVDGAGLLDDDEGDEDLRENDKDKQSATHAITWPKSPRKLWHIVKADVTEQLLELPGFFSAMTQYFRKRDLASTSDIVETNCSPNPRIRVYNSITVSYAGWVSAEVQASPSTGGSASFGVSEFTNRRPTEYVMPSQRKLQSDRLYASSLRHNTVLVRRPDLQV
jgi:hypothetical protein